jgi:hypothetical protein
MWLKHPHHQSLSTVPPEIAKMFVSLQQQLKEQNEWLDESNERTEQLEFQVTDEKQCTEELHMELGGFSAAAAGVCPSILVELVVFLALCIMQDKQAISCL